MVPRRFCGSRPKLLEVTWRHRSRDHWIARASVCLLTRAGLRAAVTSSPMIRPSAMRSRRWSRTWKHAGISYPPTTCRIQSLMLFISSLIGSSTSSDQSTKLISRLMKKIVLFISISIFHNDNTDSYYSDIIDSFTTYGAIPMCYHDWLPPPRR